MVEVGEDARKSESSCSSSSSKCFTMDESFLNDLLECSVCLEQLDSSSKVLPCQHTFCKRCLHEIVNSHKELRCPECRILVDAKIEELPCNILLVRLLEGLKNNVRPKRIVSGGGSGSSEITVPPPLALRGCRPESPFPPHPPQLPVQVSNNTSSEFVRTCVPKQILQPCPCAKALYPYEAKVPGDLSFRKGDMILLRKRVDQNWFYGELGEKSGFVPASFVQVVVPIASHVPQCKALYDFQITNGSEEKECLLTFVKGDILTVIRRVDDYWAEGKLRERIGIFPISFVEMNASARALMKLSANMVSGSSNIMPPPTPAIDSRFIPAMPVTAANTTITSTCQVTSPSISSPLAVTSTAVSSPHFSSAFTSPIHSVNSTGGINTQTQGFSAMVCGGMEQHRVPFQQPSTDSCSMEDIGHTEQQRGNLFRPRSTPSPVFTSVAPPLVTQRAESISGSQISPQGGTPLPLSHFAPSSDGCQTPSRSSTHTALPNFYLALYSYRPQKEDELELRKGELYTLTEKCQDGWYKGTSLRTSQSGVFPGNYVQLAKSAVLQTQMMTSPAGQCHTSSTSPPPVLTSIANCCQPKGANPETGSHSLNISFPGNSNCLAMVSRAPSPVTTVHHQQPQRLVRAVNPGAQGLYKTPEVQPKNVPLNQSRLPSLTPWNTEYGPVPTASQLVTDFPSRTTTSSPTHMLQYQSSSGPGNGCNMIGENHLAQSRYCVSQPSTPLTNNTTNPFIVTAGPSTVTGTCSSSISAGPSSQSRLEKHKEKKEKEIVSLMKRLTKRKSKSPPPSDFSCDNPSFVDMSSPGSGSAVATVHVRSTSCPSEALGSQGIAHKKTGSFDNCGNNEVSRSSSRPKQPAPLVRERFRCIVPYPPNSDYELELKAGDVVYVHKKRDDGWYKGTLQRTGKTGLFPSSFVEGF